MNIGGSEVQSHLLLGVSLSYVRTCLKNLTKDLVDSPMGKHRDLSLHPPAPTKSQVWPHLPAGSALVGKRE